MASTSLKSERLFLTLLARLVSNDELAFLMEMVAEFLHWCTKQNQSDAVKVQWSNHYQCALNGNDC